MQTTAYNLSNTNLSITVELSISCKDLISLDVMSKSDPMAIVYIRDKQGTSWKEVGRTEMILNNRNPVFTTPIEMQYFFEERQLMRFFITDVDDPSKAKHSEFKGMDYIGDLVCTLGEIMGNRGTITKKLENENHKNRENGSITVKAQEVSKTNQFVKFRLSGVHLDKKDFLSKSDPYVVIHRSDQNGTFSPIHKTETIMNTLDPVWKEFVLPLSRLCGGNWDAPIFIECYDWDNDGSHDLIGQFITTYRQMQDKKEFELIEPKIQQKKGSKYKNSGILKILEMTEFKLPSFLEYVTGGTEINFLVGIDFTGSNGDPSKPNSLHYRNPSGPNEYMAAIRIVGDIVAPYDPDRLFPVFGFGGYLTDLSTTSHCFALNRNENDPNIFGIDGILQAYVNAFSYLQLSGPTNFAPIFRKVASIAKTCTSGSKYFVLLMLTDGEITDMNDTIRALEECSNLPISIIIVGVGGEKFASMKVLDNDEGTLKVSRDIVQFVPFRQYTNRSLADLAKDVLMEVPKQLVDYMTKHNIQPKRPF